MLDKELRLMFCVMSTLPYEVLKRARSIEEHGDLMAVLSLRRAALRHIITDLEDTVGATYPYGHNDPLRFREELEDVAIKMKALSDVSTQVDEYFERANLISANGLANALVEFKADSSPEE